MLSLSEGVSNVLYSLHLTPSPKKRTVGEAMGKDAESHTLLAAKRRRVKVHYLTIGRI